MKDKNSIRKQACLLRTNLDKNKRKLFNKRIYETTLEVINNLPGNSAFIYESYKEEVPTEEIILALKKSQYEISTPRILKDNNMIAVDCTNKVLEFSQNPLSKKVVTDEFEVKKIDIVLVPVVAFSRDGDRLGYGGGFYDKWFSKNPSAVKIGLAYSFQQFDNIIAEEHDVKLDFVISETSLFNFKNYR